MTATAIESLLKGLATRREDEDNAAREAYRSLVVRIADERPAKGDTAEFVGQLLRRLGLDESKLASDVQRVVKFRAQAKLAVQVDSRRDELVEASAAAEEASRAYEEAKTRLLAELESAHARTRRAAREVDEARAAREAVIGAGQEGLAEAYEGALATLRTTEKAVRRGADPNRVSKRPPEVLAQMVESERKAVGKATAAYHEACERTAGKLQLGTDDGLGEQRAAVAKARRDYAKAVTAAAEEIALSLPQIREAEAAALRALASAPPRIEIE